MSSAIEVLKKEKELYLNKIKDIEEANETRASDIVEMYKRSIKVYLEFISALDEALLALENKESERRLGAVEEIKAVMNEINVIDNNTLYTKLEKRLKRLEGKK